MFIKINEMEERLEKAINSTAKEINNLDREIFELKEKLKVREAQRRLMGDFLDELKKIKG